jgi:four helix bundle suffix protein
MQDFLRQRELKTWPKDDARVRAFREFRAEWTTSNTLNTPRLPDDPEAAANMILTLCNMEGYLLSRLTESLKRKHETEGGLTENLYKKRIAYRKNNKL